MAIAPITPGILDLICYIGLPYAANLQIEMDGATITDLSSGHTAKWVVRASNDPSSRVLFNLGTVASSASDGVILAAGSSSAPNCTMNLTSASTSALVANASAYYWLEVDDKPILTGLFSVTDWGDDA